ncbi:carboxymuconolactone decarboxylase family protein [Actinomadura kijaniata]|uniref:carboxymuconolactone decarboxylase family protein n=1 Tax=Actinomadura kijaniata TaxID=46161 RepID=UPI0008335D86|nr:carboxymuconolactone decarboxylase family protein [Actinomadura kijaniata]
MTDRPRIAPLPPAERSAEQQRLVEATGTEMNIFTTLVRHPELFEDFSRFAGRLLYASTLPGEAREILILRTAYRCRAVYDWVQHVEIARGVGLPEDVIGALCTDDARGLDREAAVLAAAADQLSAHRDLDDRTWTALRERFDEHQMIELCMLVGDHAMIAGVVKALRVRLEDHQAPPSWA